MIIRAIEYMMLVMWGALLLGGLIMIFEWLVK